MSVATPAAPRDITTPSDVRAALATLKAAFATNAQARKLHPNTPAAFLTSELALHEALTSLTPIALHPALYPALTLHGGLPLLAALLSHANPDVSHLALSLLHDLASPDAADDAAALQRYAQLFAAMASARVFAALADALADRLLPGAAADGDEAVVCADGAAKAMAVFETVLDLRPDLAAVVADESRIVVVCVRAVGASAGASADAGAGTDSGTDAVVEAPDAAAVELLAVMLQHSQICRLQFARNGGMEAVLRALEAARGKKGRGGVRWEVFGAERAEVEENLLGLLCAALLGGAEVGRRFVETGGVEAMVGLMRGVRRLRMGAARVVDFACGNGAEGVERVFACGGIGVVFAMLGAVGEDGGAKRAEETRVVTEHLFGVVYSALRWGGEAGRKRVLFKLWEGGGAKTVKVLRLYSYFAQAVELVSGERGRYLGGTTGNVAGDAAGKADGEAAGDEERLEEQLEAGLLIVQMGAAVVGHVLAYGDKEFARAVREAAGGMGVTVAGMMRALREYAHSLGEKGEGERAWVEKVVADVERVMGGGN